MKNLNFNSVIVFLVVLLLGLASVCDAGDFLRTCRNTRIGQYDAVLKSTCKGINGEYSDTTLNLDKCIGNYNGNLGWSPGGGLSGSCRDFHLEFDGRDLKASCQRGDGNYSYPRININDRVGNSDGQLMCCE